MESLFLYRIDIYVGILRSGEKKQNKMYSLSSWT